MIGLDGGEVRVPILGLAINRLKIIDSQQDRESVRSMKTRDQGIYVRAWGLTRFASVVPPSKLSK